MICYDRFDIHFDPTHFNPTHILICSHLHFLWATQHGGQDQRRHASLKTIPGATIGMCSSTTRMTSLQAKSCSSTLMPCTNTSVSWFMMSLHTRVNLQLVRFVIAIKLLIPSLSLTRKRQSWAQHHMLLLEICRTDCRCLFSICHFHVEFPEAVDGCIFELPGLWCILMQKTFRAPIVEQAHN